jgi:hypothetical protein
MAPRLVLDAFHVAPVWVPGAVTLQPLTIRRWMRLEAAGNSLLAFDVPANIEDRLREVTGAASILSDGAFRHCLPEKFDDLTEAVLQVIGQGFSTALQMRDPDAKSGSADSVDLFGLSTRLLAHAVHRLRFPLDEALDTPTCKLFVLVATVDALDGKVPAGRDYFSRSVGSANPIQTTGISEAEHPENKRRDNQRRGDNDGTHPAQAACNMTVEELPSSRNDQVAQGADFHGGTLA